MNSFYYDILLTAGTFVLMGYLSIRAMRSHKVSRGNGNDEGGEEFPQEPKIDLPPGVVWPSDSPKAEREPIEV